MNEENNPILTEKLLPISNKDIVIYPSYIFKNSKIEFYHQLLN